MTATINASTTAGVVTTADTSGILQLQTNGTAALTVDASQNVGIGITSPTAKLHVAGTIRATSGGATTSAVTVTQGYINGDISSSNFSIGNYGDSSSEMRIDTRGFTTFYTGATNNATGSERVRIDSSGNVGIGTSSPGYPLDVVQKTDDSSYALQLRGYTTGADGTRTVNMRTVSSNAGDWANFRMDASSFIWRHQGGTERARIDSSGNVLVNATSQIASERVGISFDRGGQQGLAIKNTSSTSPSNASYVTFFYTSTNTGSINSTGTTTSYATTSDYRLKEDIAPMTGALAKITALKPVTYKWKSTGEVDEGFIAHELQAVCPSAVTGAKDAVKEEQYEITPAVKDEEGNTITEAVMGTRTVPVYQGIDTSFLVATLTAAIQELKAVVDAQAARITALEGATA